jgi:hypothetical protein
MSVHELSEMVELTAEFGGMKVCKVAARNVCRHSVSPNCLSKR